MRMLHSFYIPLCLSFAGYSLAQTSLSLSPAPRASNAAVSLPLDPSFAGFGIEPSNLFSFTGHEDPNDFSIQLMQNLADYSGTAPHIRLGGNTQDYMIFDESYDAYDWKSNPDSTAQGTIAADSMLIGAGYFKSLDRFPGGTPITFGLNLAYQGSDYNETIVRMAQAAVEGMNNVKLVSFEIGNEPDLWLENNFRSAPWNGQVYTNQFLQRAEVLYNEVLKPAGLPSRFFEPPATASTIGTTFEIEMLVQDGMIEPVNGNDYVVCWNQHDYYYFIGVTQRPITLTDLLRFDSTNEQFAYWEQQIGIALDTGLPYALREMSSVGPIGMHGVSDTFAASLWTLNFFLYMATLNVSSVQMHMTDNSNASAWQPINMYGNDPFVRPQYYAHAAMAQIIGNGNGTTQIGELDVSGVSVDYNGVLRAYPVYAGGELQAMVLLNGKQANASQSNKDSFTFTVNFGKSNGNQDVFISYLTADGADSLSGTTFNGVEFSNDDGKPRTVDDSVTILRTSSSGSVVVKVRDSQAAVVNIGSLLGSNTVLTNGTTSNKKSSAGPTRTQGANTAILTSIATTTLAVASSVVEGGEVAQETGNAESAGETIDGRGRILWAMVVCLMAVMTGFVYLA
ncbi:hypothetical protein CC78DRAFT_352917 [Lojkania enalia]|uniref:Beta-glucuronidase C-terminal domain-containing protein n=1 Tax=Lojkania enalia TaxID=147567 RepID=A0A9P4N6S3_9PLEO|nr:hypothetical protein CC78DRAFT_352917 [Didymosphaeria enalia]